jgi:hypothetical protein
MRIKADVPGELGTGPFVPDPTLLTMLGAIENFGDILLRGFDTFWELHAHFEDPRRELRRKRDRGNARIALIRSTLRPQDSFQLDGGPTREAGR